jgi:hypothetical protein
MIGNGTHFTGINTPGGTTAKITHIGNIIVDLYGTDGTECFAGTAKITKGRGDFNTAPVGNGYGFLGAVRTIMFQALMTDNRKVNAFHFNFFNFYPGAKMSCFS